MKKRVQAAPGASAVTGPRPKPASGSAYATANSTASNSAANSPSIAISPTSPASRPKLIVELDGGQHADEAAYDAARTKVLEQAGFRVLRFWNHAVLTELDGVLHEISFALKAGRT